MHLFAYFLIFSTAGCTKTCQNGGTCWTDGGVEKCYCDPDYMGDDCSDKRGQCLIIWEMREVSENMRQLQTQIKAIYNQNCIRLFQLSFLLLVPYVTCFLKVAFGRRCAYMSASWASPCSPGQTTSVDAASQGDDDLGDAVCIDGYGCTKNVSLRYHVYSILSTFSFSLLSAPLSPSTPLSLHLYLTFSLSPARVSSRKHDHQLLPKRQQPVHRFCIYRRRPHRHSLFSHHFH